MCARAPCTRERALSLCAICAHSDDSFATLSCACVGPYECSTRHRTRGRIVLVDAASCRTSHTGSWAGWDLTGRVTPHARPRAALEGTNTYGTFCTADGHCGLLRANAPVDVCTCSVGDTEGCVSRSVRTFCSTLRGLRIASECQADAIVIAENVYTRSRTVLAPLREGAGSPARSGTLTQRTLSSASKGRCSRISMGSVSPAITTMDEMPRFRVLVAAAQTSCQRHAAARLVRPATAARPPGRSQACCALGHHPTVRFRAQFVANAPSLAPFLSCW